MIIGFFGQTNKWTHDHSLAILENGKIKTFVQLERITRRKYDNRLPDYLGQVLIGAGLPLEDLDSHEIGYANTFSLEPDFFFKKADNRISSSNGNTNLDSPRSSELKPQEAVGTIEHHHTTAKVIPHEIAHLFSIIPFYGMFKDNSLLVHIDGAASVCNASAWYYKANQLTLLETTTEFHHALLNYSYNDLVFNLLKLDKEQHLGLPGRLMGYASYGMPDPNTLKWLESRDFFLDYSIHPRSQYFQEAKRFGYNRKAIVQKHPFSFDVAACIQKHFENRLFQFIRKQKDRTGAKYLYYAGGAALNIKLNAKIVNSRLFEEVFIPPPANDSGLSLGVVCYIAWERNLNIALHGPFLNNYDLKLPQDGYEFSVDDICTDLAKGLIVGLWIGPGEAGPRALGNRSILAHPGKISMRRRVSRQMKGREWYRPLAPIVLESELNSLFEDFVGSPIMHHMLYEFRVKEKAKDSIQAVVHVDGTARAQVVKEEDSDLKLVIEILQTMKDQYEVPCLINTSFNGPGDPIVHRKDEALTSAQRIGLDAIVLGEQYIRLR